jgi:predicted phage tail protein
LAIPPQAKNSTTKDTKNTKENTKFEPGASREARSLPLYVLLRVLGALGGQTPTRTIPRC